MDSHSKTAQPPSTTGTEAAARADTAPAAGTAPQNTESAKASKEALLKAFEKIPYVGPWLAVVFEKWGWAGLLLFVSGSVLTAGAITGTVYFGVYPQRLVSDKYKAPAATGPKAEQTVARTKPQGAFALNTTQEQADWLDRLIQLYKLEARNQMSEADRFDFNVRAFEHHLDKPSEPFIWSLHSDSEYEITGRAFRVISLPGKEPGRELLEQLGFELSEDSHTVSFRVPECDEGDKLLAVVLVRWRHGRPVEDLLSTFRSTAQ